MPAGFLLHFQEAPAAAIGGRRSAKIETSVDKEGPDVGPITPFAATKTLTEVKREQPDADPRSQSLYAIPR
jgi:hypothetical protein